MWHSCFRWIDSRNQDERQLLTYSSHSLFAFSERTAYGLLDIFGSDDGKQEPNTITNGKDTFKTTSAHIMHFNVQIHKRACYLWQKLMPKSPIAFTATRD